MLPRSADWWLLERCNHVDNAHAELDDCTDPDATVVSQNPGEPRDESVLALGIGTKIVCNTGTIKVH
jgi:hypothetical protein